FKLQAIGIRAYIVYFPFSADAVIPQPYRKYNPNPVHRIEDEPGNIVVIPEVLVALYIDHYKKIRKLIWWLSLANYFSQIGAREAPGLDSLAREGIYNFVQSAHTKAFLDSHHVRVDGYLGGYINSVFREENGDRPIRYDNVLYNPRKGYEFTSRLMQAAPELNWVALQNMSVADIKNAFHSSKVYVDFGHHPGRDRFPREAAISGCCIITGISGSAAFFEDVPIPDAFKFNEKTASLEDIIRKIEQCLSEYDALIAHFRPLSERVRKEEEKMIADIDQIFIRA